MTGYVYRILCVFLALTLYTSANAAQKKAFKDVNIGDLVRETQKQEQIRGSSGKNALRVAWWVPLEYWQASLGASGKVTTAMMEQMIKELSPYYIIALVQTEISTFGAFDFYSKNEIRQNASFEFVDAQGKSKVLQPLIKLDGNIALLLQNMKPVLSAAMGNLGRNMHFYAFSNADGKGGKLLSPYKSGKLKIKLKDRVGAAPSVLEIETLIDALHVPRKCSNGKNAHISWKYCPWDGQKLAN